jgi:hypothetical protein
MSPTQYAVERRPKLDRKRRLKFFTLIDVICLYLRADCIATHNLLLALVTSGNLWIYSVFTGILF